MTQPQDLTQAINGFDCEAMATTVNALSDDPTLAQFQFRASNRWIDGGTNRSRIKEFYGAGAEDESRTEPFEFVNGEPPVLLNDNEGANPVEFLLHALAGCVTTTTVLHAAARGIRIERPATRLVGDIDLQGLLGLDESVPSGYESIAIQMDIEADCSPGDRRSIRIGGSYSRVLGVDFESRSQLICMPGESHAIGFVFNRDCRLAVRIDCWVAGIDLRPLCGPAELSLTHRRCA